MPVRPDRATVPDPAFASGDLVGGFQIAAVSPLPDISAMGYIAEHLRTGAQVLLLHCHDPQNLFSVGFRTPLPDDTGITHVLEHCVMAGSRRYPLRDAFGELSKHSLGAYNGMTWPDRTVYAVWSAVPADTFNLARVFADLVFQPLLTERTFEREAWHLELADPEDPDSPVILVGTVFNEMKGFYASIEQSLMERVYRQLAADSPYAWSFGGDPERIPDLTHAALVDFHRRTYTASNARFLLYGDCAPQANLDFLDEILAPLARGVAPEPPAAPPRWTAPRRLSLAYPAEDDKAARGRGFVILAWLAGETSDMLEMLKLEVALSAFAGSTAAPLRRAFSEAGLGLDLFPSSPFDDSSAESRDLRQAMVALGLRGCDTARADEVEALILATLTRILREGLDRELVEAALHRVDLKAREITPPFGLTVLFRQNPAWYYGGDPFAGLAVGAALVELRAAYAAQSDVFAQALRKRLLDNPHRLRVVALPDALLAARDEEALRARLAAERQRLGPAGLARLRAEAQAIRADQETPDPPEALATLPRLTPGDIPRRLMALPTRRSLVGDIVVLEHPIFANGLAHVGLSFDTVDLSDEEAALLPLLGRATFALGAGDLDAGAMARRMARATGSMDAAPLTGHHLVTGARFERLALDVSLVPSDAGGLRELLRELLTASRLAEGEGMGDLLRAAAADARARMGARMAMATAAAVLGPASHRSELWTGLSQLRLMADLAREMEDPSAVKDLGRRLAVLRDRVFVRSRAQVSLAADAAHLPPLCAAMLDLLSDLPLGSPAERDNAARTAVPRRCGVTIPGQVNHLGMVLDAPPIGHPAAPALALLAVVLGGRLWTRIRVQGGAYLGQAWYEADKGQLQLVSYRDPNLVSTVDCFITELASLTAGGVTDAAIDDARISAVGSFDAILAPPEQLAAARRHLFMGLTDAQRLAHRDGLLDLDAAEVRRLALPFVATAPDQLPLAVLASGTALEAANLRLRPPLELVALG
jgi:Zn-dependent M16 (insulinase) family peptidase